MQKFCCQDQGIHFMKHCWHTMALKPANIILFTKRNWEINLEHLEIVAKKNTIVMVLGNTNNHWSVVFSHNHLAKVAEMENKLGLSIIYEGVYELKLCPVAST